LFKLSVSNQQPDLSNKNSKAEEKLSELDKAIVKGNNAVQELQLYTHFNSTVLAAQNDDRQAYDQLFAWTAEKTFPYKKAASEAVQAVMEQYDPAIYKNFSLTWDEGVDPHKLSLPELWQAYKSAPADTRVGLLEFVWTKRTDLSRRHRLQFLVDVLRSDESLKVVEYAGRYFSQGTKDSFKPIAISQHIEWWNKNKDTIK